MNVSLKAGVFDLGEARWEVCAHAHRPLSKEIPVSCANEWEWLSVELPVDILSFLKQSGRIGDPFVGRNDLACRWVEELDWAFRTRFDMAPDQPLTPEICLVLREIDCWGEVFLNTRHIGTTRNQFREYRFSLGEFLRPSDNELVIYLRSAKRVSEVLERVHGQLPALFDSSRVHARRCQCLTGWDWTARLSSAGILQTPQLEMESFFSLEVPFAYVREQAEVEPGAPTADWAVVVAQVDIVAQRRAKARLVGEILDPEGTVLERSEVPLNITAGRATSRLSFRLRDAQLWWPLGFGEQPQYSVRFFLSGEDRAGSSFCAQTQSRFGVRTVALLRKKDAAGESFVPTVNGISIFCRGANWIPLSMLPSQVTSDDYQQMVYAAASAGMNCLRVWGGGIYEKDLFYKLCDELGILVWQDFMFACAAYPVYRDFLDEVEAEAIYQIQRLRNHPCLLLWCGNNENEWIHQSGGLRKGEEKRVIGEQIWSSLLKDRVEELDPSRYYQQSSPFGRRRDDLNDPTSGDRHAWQVWGEWHSPQSYLVDPGRFITEFGLQALPLLTSIKQFAPEANDMNDGELLHHQRVADGQERLVRYAAQLFAVPKRFEDWVDATQRTQAELLRRAVEHWRRRRFDTAGTLIWQFNDAYSAISWSMIDYFRRPKRSYELARHFFAPICLSVALLEDAMEVGSFSPLSDQANMPAETPVPVSAPDEAPLFGAVPGAVRELEVVLINDTSLALSGRLIITSHHAQGQELTSRDYELQILPNAKSEAIRLSLEVLEITDICAQFVRARFEPDELSLAGIETLEKTIERQMPTTEANAAQGTAQLPVLQLGFTADVMLVEPKFFHWYEQVAFYGQEKPSWHCMPGNDRA